jgi:hypothetical protein
MLIVEAIRVAQHGAHAPVIAQAALPIIPILLFPFILVFFVLVFPLWLVSVAVLSVVLFALRGLAALAHRGKPGALDGPVAGVTRARRWVLTIGGLTDRYMHPDAAP